MARKSARLLGQEIGMNAKEVNKLLETIGLIKRGRAVTQTGSPTWELTELGKAFGEPSKHPYSSGHIWDDEVIGLIKKFLSR